MNATSFDIITVGGGLAASTFAKSMAERGANVLILEREERFKDRVRGEFIVTWGGRGAGIGHTEPAAPELRD